MCGHAREKTAIENAVIENAVITAEETMNAHAEMRPAVTKWVM